MVIIPVVIVRPNLCALTTDKWTMHIQAVRMSRNTQKYLRQPAGNRLHKSHRNFLSNFGVHFLTLMVSRPLSVKIARRKYHCPPCGLWRFSPPQTNSKPDFIAHLNMNYLVPGESASVATAANSHKENVP